MDPLDEPLERDLRSLLTDDRLALPTHLVDVHEVHAGATRRRRRRAAGTAVAGAVLVAAVAGSVLLAYPSDRPDRAPVGGSTQTSLQPGPTFSHASSTPSGSSASAPGAVAGPRWDGATVTSMTATSTRTLVALGTTGGASCHSCLRLAVSHDSGRSFTPLRVPGAGTFKDLDHLGTPTTPTQVRFGSGSDGWLFGSGLWSTHDGGHSWTRKSLGGPVLRVEAAAGTVWALVGDGNNSETLWRSPVDRDNWVPVPSVTVAKPADLAVQGSRVVVLGAGRASSGWSNVTGRFVRTQNPCAGSLGVGLTWSERLWATCQTGTAAGVATSVDGTSWTSVPVATGQGSLPNSIAVGARSPSEAVVAIAQRPLSRLATDGRLTAVRSAPPGDGTASYIGFTTREVGYAIVGTRLWRTDDGAATWHRLDLAR
jgi:hypothetical protein